MAWTEATMMKVAAVERPETNITDDSSRDNDSQTADSAVTAQRLTNYTTGNCSQSIGSNDD